MVIPLSTGALFAGAVMAGVAYMALPIPRLICMEVLEGLLPALRHRSGLRRSATIRGCFVSANRVLRGNGLAISLRRS